jgi:hypothetical protein
MHLRNYRITQNTIIAKFKIDTEDEVKNVGVVKSKRKTALEKRGCSWQNITEVNFNTLKMEIGLNWP